LPTYGYRCANHHEFEIFQSMSDDAIASCPECGERARRLFYPTGIVFKGNGFYKTDSRAKTDPGAGAGSGEAVESKAASGEKSPEKSGDKGAEKSDSGGKTQAPSKPSSGDSTPGKGTTTDS